MNKAITELAHLIDQVQETELRQLLQQQIAKLKESNGRRIEILGLAQSALAQLRLDIKYMQFDLEATRRERDEALKG